MALLFLCNVLYDLVQRLAGQGVAHAAIHAARCEFFGAAGQRFIRQLHGLVVGLVELVRYRQNASAIAA